MHYNLFCDACKKTVQVSTRNAIKTEKSNGAIELVFACPECEGGITAQYLYKKSRRVA